jgi:hypothetical protein
MAKAEQTNSTPHATERSVEEAYGLKRCAAWHVHRAQQRLHWASRDLDDLQGNDPGALDVSSLESMKEIEGMLRDWEPETPYGAARLLEIALEIQTYAATIDPGDHFGQGPALDYLRNLRRSIDRFPDETAP